MRNVRCPESISHQAFLISAELKNHDIPSGCYISISMSPEIRWSRFRYITQGYQIAHVFSCDEPLRFVRPETFLR